MDGAGIAIAHDECFHHGAWHAVYPHNNTAFIGVAAVLLYQLSACPFHYRGFNPVFRRRHAGHEQLDPVADDLALLWRLFHAASSIDHQPGSNAGTILLKAFLRLADSSSRNTRYHADQPAAAC
ncbi:hypothetical protein [Pseudomethylobacillus aquaticus]|uniref:hypothetical protein n=1 Tax=Pseudomethylobacillus aquaticus TaxID=2676064 RepID=UPI001F00D655|nr:hypothetical protein [Pseudomethylobacillus aquaticus]